MYHAEWFRFDNATGESQSISSTQASTTTIEGALACRPRQGSFVRVDISADSEGHPTEEADSHLFQTWRGRLETGGARACCRTLRRPARRHEGDELNLLRKPVARFVILLAIVSLSDVTSARSRRQVAWRQAGRHRLDI
jgi:hypothetical protein